MAEDKGTIGNLVAAFLVGAAVGGGIALLTAPRSGRETRAKIKDMAGEARDRMRHLAEEGKEIFAEKRDMMKAAVTAGREAMAEEKARHVKTPH